jgi:hypothetical protein
MLAQSVNAKDLGIKLRKQAKFAWWGVISLVTIGVFSGLVLLAPLWIFLFIINLPLIVFGAFLLMFTNILNPIVKLYWRSMFGILNW